MGLLSKILQLCSEKYQWDQFELVYDETTAEGKSKIQLLCDPPKPIFCGSTEELHLHFIMLFSGFCFTKMRSKIFTLTSTFLFCFCCSVALVSFNITCLFQKLKTVILDKKYTHLCFLGSFSQKSETFITLLLHWF